MRSKSRGFDAMRALAGYLLVVLALWGGLATPAAAQSLTSYRYDALGRLKQVSYSLAGCAPHAGLEYEYDAAGNRTRTAANAGAQPCLVNISVGSASGMEGTTASFKITRTGDRSRAVTLQYATAHGTALALDYQGVSGSISLTPGQTEATIAVPLRVDVLIEPTETFTLNVSSTDPNVQFSPASGTGYVLDRKPSEISRSPLALSPYAIEGGAAFFVYERRGDLSQAATLWYQTYAGSAIPHVDFLPASGSVVFAPGQAVAIVAVKILARQQAQGDRNFSVVVGSDDPSVAVTGPPTQGIIKDNTDTSRTIIQVVPLASAQEGGMIQFQAIRSGNLNQSTALIVAPTGSATVIPDGDFLSVLPNVSFSPGQRTKLIQVPTLHDSLLEGDETFSITVRPRPGSPNTFMLNATGQAVASVQVQALIKDNPAKRKIPVVYPEAAFANCKAFYLNYPGYTQCGSLAPVLRSSKDAPASTMTEEGYVFDGYDFIRDALYFSLDLLENDGHLWEPTSGGSPPGLPGPLWAAYVLPNDGTLILADVQDISLAARDPGISYGGITGSPVLDLSFSSNGMVTVYPDFNVLGQHWAAGHDQVLAVMEYTVTDTSSWEEVRGHLSVFFGGPPLQNLGMGCYLNPYVCVVN